MLFDLQAITMGVGTILDARQCLLLATGLEKADVVAKAIEGPLTAMVTATALQLHPACTIVLDQDAASQLKENDHYQRPVATPNKNGGPPPVRPQKILLASPP